MPPPVPLPKQPVPFNLVLLIPDTLPDTFQVPFGNGKVFDSSSKAKQGKARLRYSTVPPCVPRTYTF